MRKILLLLVCLFALQTAISKPLPLEAFTRAEQYHGIKISPNGKYLAAVSTANNSRVLVILDREQMKTTYVYRFGEKKHVTDYHWAGDDRIVFREYYKEPWSAREVSDGQIYAGNFDGSKRKVIFGIGQTKLMQGRAVRGVGAINMYGQVLDPLPDDPEHILVEAENFDEDSDATKHIYQVNTFTGKRKLITRSPFGRMGFLTNAKGELKMGYGTDRNGDYRIFMFEDNQWKEVGDKETLNNTTPYYYDEENNKLILFAKIRGGTSRLFEYDINTDQMVTIFNDQNYDIASILSHPVSGKVYGVKTMPGEVKASYLNKKDPMAKSHRMLAKTFPGYDITIPSATRDGNIIIVKASNDKNPGDYYLFNRETKKADYVLSAMQWLDPEQMADRKPISFKARDGEKIYGYLTLPKGKAKDLPLVTYVHGGPYGVKDTWYFDKAAQMLANNGYAVLQVNYRGSGGYGEAFESVAFQKRGSLIQHDIIDGTRWAMSQPEISDDACIMGWSFGGYSAVMAPIVEPDLFKCSVAAAGLYDAALQEKEADYATVDSIRKVVAKEYGNDEELLKAESPITYIDKFNIPVLIVHGTKDERVTFSQAELLVEELEKRNKPFETLFKKGEGHFGFNPENTLDYYQTTLKFLDKHIR